MSQEQGNRYTNLFFHLMEYYVIIKNYTYKGHIITFFNLFYHLQKNTTHWSVISNWVATKRNLQGKIGLKENALIYSSHLGTG